MVARKECGYVQSITHIHDYGYTYDGRGNLIKEEEICSPTTQGPKNITIATYTYDETNKMVSGTNKDGEVSNYTFNGLGVRVGTEVIVKDNTHGYTDFHCQTPTVETGIDKPEVVLSDYVIDYTRLNIDQRVLVESETDGYDFRYTYGLDLVNVKATGEGTNWWAQSVKKCVYSDYVHTDRLGSVVNLTDQYGRIPAQVDYDDWGKVTAYQSLNISGGYRTVLPEITYAGHQYDDVLGMYYAKARMYDAENRRFAGVDPVKGNITEPMSLVQYLYVVDNPLRWVDLLGLAPRGVPLPESVVHDVSALPRGTELIAEPGNLQLYDSYSKSGNVLATIPIGGRVFSQNEAKTNAGITWYKVSYNGKIGWVDANYFQEKKNVPVTSPIPTAKPETTLPSANDLIDAPDKEKPEKPSVLDSAGNTLQYVADAVVGAFLVAVTATGTVLEDVWDYGARTVSTVKTALSSFAFRIYSHYSDKSYFDIYTCDGLHTGFSTAQYGEITKEIVIREATARYSTSNNRPTAMSCVIDKKTGMYYID